MSTVANAPAVLPERVSLATGDVRIPVYGDGAGPVLREVDQAYPVAAGADDLRAAVAATVGAGTEPVQVVIAPGARLAILAVLRTVLGQRRQVLVPTPFWPSYPELIRAAGGEPVLVPGAVGVGTPDLAELARRSTAGTGAVLLNSPRNPDGAVIGQEQLRELVAWATRRDLVVVFDQVYRGVPADAGPATSVCDLPEFPSPRLVMIDGLTKSHALAGLRVGWAVAEPSVAAATAATGHHLYGGTCTAAQQLAVRALAPGPHRERLVAELAAVLAANRRLAMTRLAALPGVEVRPPAGGIFLFPDLRGWQASAAPAAARRDLVGWLREHGVVVGDGAGFGASGHVRLSFAVPTGQLAAGLDRLEAAIGDPGHATGGPDG